ncbi:hypothetical protein BKM15_26190 [Pseudomonas syringae pv. syringae]|nr:hypothetical protein BKM15_26190 [Pseudomonas syringae pv. syringae]
MEGQNARDKLTEIKSRWWLDNEQPLAIGDAADVRWLINEIENLQAENEQLKIVAQAYDALKKAL